MRSKKKQTGFYESMMERVNLQSIGYYIRERTLNNLPDETTISERIKKADNKLYTELGEHFDHETIKILEHIILPYIDVTTAAHFSLGMKVGAKLAFMLTGDNDTDF